MKTSEMHEMLMAAFVQWPHILITDPLLKLWHGCFRDIPRDKFWVAMLATIKSSANNFPPTIGEVNRKLTSLAESENNQLSEGQAWKLLDDAVRKFGSYSKPQAMDWIRERSELVYEAVDLLGWSAICNWQTKDEVGNRAHFWKIYQSAAKRETDRKLIGGDKINQREAIEYKLKYPKQVESFSDVAQNLITNLKF